MGFRRGERLRGRSAPAGLQDTISGPADAVGSTHTLSHICHQLRQVPGASSSSTRHVGKGSRRSSGRYKVSRLLQQAVRCTKEKGKMEASDRPQPIEQVNTTYKVQNGDNQNCVVFNQKGAVVHVDRPDRCIFSYSDPPQKQEVPALCLRGRGVPISGSVLRNFTSTSDIHRGDESRRLTCPPPVNSSAPVYRRLVVRGGHGRSSITEHSMVAANSILSGIAGKLRQIGVSTHPTSGVSGCLDRHGQVSGFPVHPPGGQFPVSYTSLPDSVRKVDVGMVVTPRTHGFVGETRLPFKNQNENFTVPFEDVLDRTNTEEPRRPYHLGLPPSADLVGRPRTSIGGRLTRDDRTRLLPVYGCVDGGLGSHRRPSTVARPVVIEGDPVSHQCTRAGSSGERSSRVPTVSVSGNGVCDVRQHHGGVSHQPPRRHALKDSLRQDGESGFVVREESNRLDVEVHSGTPKRHGRSTQSSTPDSEERVVLAPRRSPSSVAGLGQTDDRSVRNSPESQASDILLSRSRRSSRGGRCNVTEMVTFSRVRIPAISSDSSDFEQSSHGRSGDDSDSPVLAESRMVSGPPSIADGASAGATSVGPAATPTPHEGLSPTTGVPGITRLEAVAQSLQAKGFSKPTADLIAGGHRTSTSALYQSKWQTFLDWCGGRQIDPLSASVCIVADFLTFLFQTKQFTVSTIKGYRSALSQVFRPRGVDLTNDENLTALIKAMEIQRPIVRSQVPKWDLSLVLRSLTRPPYEPMRLADLKHLMQKTVFLTLLATAKRVSEVHALSCMFSHSEGWKDIVLQFDPSFVAKTQKPSDPSTGLSTVTIPALAPSVEEGLPDRTLCAVRAIRYYVDHTSSFRAGRKRLFLPIQTGRLKDISKNTLSHWAKDVILRAYASATEEDAGLSLRNASVHELRALSTTLLFHKSQSLTAVMEAACWRGNTTFSTFYLRDLSLTLGGLTSLGPFVAGQEVVGLE